MVRKATVKILEPLRTVRRVLPILWASARGWSIAALFLMMLEIFFGLLSLYLIKSLIDAITMLGVDDEVMDLNDVLVQVSAFGAATLAFLTARSFSALAQEAQGMRVADYVDRLLHNQAIRADLSFFESPAYFDTLQRARSTGNQRPAQVTANILRLGKNLIMVAAVTALLMSINKLLLPILLIAVVPSLLVRIYFTRLLYEWRRERTPLDRRAGYLDWLMTSDIHAKELRINGLGYYLRDLYSDLRGTIRKENFRISKRRTFVELAVTVSATFVFFVALAFLAIETANERNTVGDLVLFLVLFQRAQSMGQELVSQISKFYEDHLYIGLLFEFLDIKPKLAEASEPVKIPSKNQIGLKVESLNFTYPGCEIPVLTDINLEIQPGQTVAMVGANGSGKTTLLKLLARLYDPTDGRIIVDGKDIKEYQLGEYRRLCSVVFQDFARYNETIGENIRFGDIRLPVASEELMHAAKRAGADEFIENLPRRYDTLMSRTFADGHEISVGQWQKVALARALLPSSRIVILDEPTSALDPRAEFELFENFKERISGKSALIISHRLSTIRMADYIYVLEGGRIVEHGTHRKLMESRGFYYDAYSKQGKYYQEEGDCVYVETS